LLAIFSIATVFPSNRYRYLATVIFSGQFPYQQLPFATCFPGNSSSLLGKVVASEVVTMESGCWGKRWLRKGFIWKMVA